MLTQISIGRGKGQGWSRLGGIVAGLLLLLAVRTTAQSATDHAGFFSTYEGSKTCRTCHEDAVDELTQTIHYTMLGQPQDVFNMFTNLPVTGLQGKGNRY